MEHRPSELGASVQHRPSEAGVTFEQRKYSVELGETSEHRMSQLGDALRKQCLAEKYRKKTRRKHR